MAVATKEIQAKSASIAARVAALHSRQERLDTVIKQKSKPVADPKALAAVKGVPTAPPWARHGEDPMSSRGFSIVKALCNARGLIPDEEAKVEREQCEWFTKAALQMGYRPTMNPCMLVPFGFSMLPDNLALSSEGRVFKSLMRAGLQGADPEEAWRYAKSFQANNPGYSAPDVKDMSWLLETSGGALVAPPEQGEVIMLLRNKEAIINAGGQVIPLPPQGRLVYPRVTSPTVATWLGENTSGTESDLGTGEIEFSAKKLFVYTKLPNELIRFASPAAEVVLRTDMATSLALGLDLGGLEGTGGSNQPLGIINMPNISTITSSQTGANGDTLVPQDMYRLPAQIEANNAEFTGYIMRPAMFWRLVQLRADAVAQGDSAGLFLFNVIRAMDGKIEKNISGWPVTTTNQVSRTRSKGTATNLSYIVGGMWQQAIFAMFGAIEYAATAVGDTAFTKDQTWVRGILSADFNVRYENAFVLLDNLSYVVGGGPS